MLFYGERCFVVDKENKKMIVSRLKEQDLYKIVDDEVAESHALMTSGARSNNYLWQRKNQMPLINIKISNTIVEEESSQSSKIYQTNKGEELCSNGFDGFYKKEAI